MVVGVTRRRDAETRQGILRSVHRRAQWLVFASLTVAFSAAATPHPDPVHRGGPMQGTHRLNSSRGVTLTLLSTTDIHGHVEPWNYLTGRPADLGLAKIATLVRRIRAEKAGVLLLDCGDATEGTPFAYYFARKELGPANPTVAAMNAMHYDAMALGNHEFNFGLAALWRAKGEAHFPWLAANIEQEWPGGVRHFAPYVIREVSGIRVGIVGFVTPAIPHWEAPSHYEGYRFEPIVEAARRIIPELRPKVDLVVALVHSGLDRNPATGRMGKEIFPEENVAWELAEGVSGIDVIFFGHTHRELPEKFISGVLLSQAKNWGESLAEAEVTFTREANGRWQIVGKHSRTIPVTAEVPADPEIMKLATPYQAKVERFLNTPIAVSPAALSGAFGRLRDDPLIDLLHKAQMDAGHAAVSLATLLYDGAYFPAGTITIRQVFSLYPYADELDTVEMTGAELKQALEHAASFYPRWPFPPGRVELPGYDADSAEGVSYRIDLTQPAGQRIEGLSYRGKPLDSQARLRVAISSYRKAGGGGYSVFRGLPVVSESKKEEVELLIDYLKRTGKVPVQADENWAIVPPEAARALLDAARAAH